MSKLLSSFTLHLLNQKFSFHFLFFYPAFPSNPEANSNFKFQHLFKLRDHIEGTIYPSGQISRTSKIFNQYIPEIHTLFHQAHPWVLSTSDQQSFYINPVWCLLWLGLNTASARTGNLFLNAHIQPVSLFPVQTNSVLAKTCVKLLGWSVWNRWYWPRKQHFHRVQGKMSSSFPGRTSPSWHPVLCREKLSSLALDRNERCCY